MGRHSHHHHHHEHGDHEHVCTSSCREYDPLDNVLRVASRLAYREAIAEAETTASKQQLAQRLAAARRRFESAWLSATVDFQSAIRRRHAVTSVSGTDSKSAFIAAAVAELEGRWHAAIQQGWTEAFKLGALSRGATAPTTTRAIYQASPELRADVGRVMTHASRFAQEYAAGLPGTRRRPFGFRSDTYAKAMGAAYQFGAVAAGKPGEKIIWKLGACDHCTDCPAIAASGPYTRQTLPAVPGQGLTRCSHNCCCVLVFVPGPPPGREAPEDLIQDMLDDPGPPPGFRGPSEQERLILIDLESRMNHARRRMASEVPGTDEHSRWMRIRRELNERIIDFTEGRSIYWTPRFSVPEVIDGLDIGVGDVNRLLMRGADGITINAADLAPVLQQLAVAVEEFQAAAAAASITGAVPAVPELEALLRRFGAPSSAMGDE